MEYDGVHPDMLAVLYRADPSARRTWSRHGRFDGDELLGTAVSHAGTRMRTRTRPQAAK